MKIHSLNCATLCPPCRQAVNGHGSYWERGHLICHCLLVETERDGLILIDTGLGTADCESPQERLGKTFLSSSKPFLRREETALHQVEALGFRSSDVRHILLTHLDLDHAGGLSDFPEARVHLLADEKKAAEERKALAERTRYRPLQWSSVTQWELYPASTGERWRNLENVQSIRGIREELLLVPLQGHTRGHAGFALPRMGKKQRDLLHCGDAYFHSATIKGRRSGRQTPWGLAAFQAVVAVEKERMFDTQNRLQKLYETSITAGENLEIFCAHDPEERTALLDQLN
jgi:glyoxylase-like metal-dependent hydrolase (beta-lactamase superfamily II)